MNIAIIPARIGSKRIFQKNIRPFAGKPMISYSIHAAFKSGIFEDVIVSTDSEEIAEIARKSGASVPFMRPAELADDHTPTAPVISHAVEWYTKNNTEPDYACCIYATAPFIKPEFIRKGFEIMQETGCSTSYPVTSFPFPIFRGLKITAEGKLAMFWPEHELSRSQDLPDAYHDAGQFYWVDCKKFLKEPTLYAKDSRPIILPRSMVQDIDTPEDWKTAEYMFSALKLDSGE